MPAFLALTEFLVGISLILALISNYLIINKLWKRRAVREVTESISVSAALLGLSTSLPFLVLFSLIDHSTAGVVKTSIGIATGLAFVMIGSGVWVADFHGRRFSSLFMRALRLERSESADLLKSIIQPKGADRLLRVLGQLAAVDGHVDEMEMKLIRDFAQQWHLTPPEPDEIGQVDFFTLRASVVHYLAVAPPREQAGQALDLLHLLSKADDHVSPEEQLALDEVDGMIRHYLAGDDAVIPAYEVLLVPQSEAQVRAVRELLPSAQEKMVRGGRVFSVGSFFSPAYAEAVCQKYISLGIFTTRVAQDVLDPSLAETPGTAGMAS